jgi:formate/nitrite transporter
MTPDAPAPKPADPHPMSRVEAFTPAEVALLLETRGVRKADGHPLTTFVLSILAGAFIAMGAMLATVVLTGSTLGFGPTRWLSGFSFALGLILVVVGGAELFTGNNLIVMSWVGRRISFGQVLRNWAIVYAGNLLGALSVVLLLHFGDWWKTGDGGIGATALGIAASKAGLPFATAFFRGILANALVCLAVWLAMAGRTVVDKVLAMLFPVAAFVAGGFEHCIANMYFIPAGLLLKGRPEAVAASGLSPEKLAGLDLGGFLNNLAASTLGNIVGGAALVGLVYWFVYLRDKA